MGTIELRAFRCQALRTVQYQGLPEYGLHQGRVSERSKKAGWHHVGYVICLSGHPSQFLSCVILIDPPSTADEIPSAGPRCSVYADYFDPQDVPYVTLKVFYRPRGGSFHTSYYYHLADALPDLLMAQGVIVGHNVGARNSGESDVNDRKRARDDGSPTPSKRRSGTTVKSEEISGNAREQRIQALQVSGANLCHLLLQSVASDGCACRLN